MYMKDARSRICRGIGGGGGGNGCGWLVVRKRRGQTWYEGTLRTARLVEIGGVVLSLLVALALV